MNNLQNAIEQTEREIENLREQRRTADIEQYATLDRQILRREMTLRNLKDSKCIGELREKGQEPTDCISWAIIHATELLDRAGSQGKDMNGTDPQVSASVRLTDLIERLELLRMATEDLSNEPISDNCQFTEQFEHYIREKQDKVTSAQEKIRNQDHEIERIESALQESMSAGNSEEIIAFSESLENAKKSREYLEPMVQAAREEKTFPDGIFAKAWNDICDIYRPEWSLRIEIIRTAQAIHHQAICELSEFATRLRSIRSDLQRIGKENGSTEEIVKGNQNITKGIDLKDIIQIDHNEREMIYRAIYHNRGELL